MALIKNFCYILIYMSSIEGFGWSEKRYIVNIKIENQFVNVYKDECGIKCFEKRYYENFQLKLVQFDKSTRLCGCHDGDINSFESNSSFASFVIDVPYYSRIGRSQHQLDLDQQPAKVGRDYRASTHQASYCYSSDTITEVFGIDDLNHPTNISIRLEFPYIDKTLEKEDYKAERSYPMTRFFANYFSITKYKKTRASRHTVKFAYMVTDMNITTNKTWMVMMTHNVAMVTILMKTIDIDIQPKVASSINYSEIKYYNTTAMKIEHAVITQRNSTTDMLNSFLFIEAENSNVKLVYEKSKIMQPKSVSTELNNRRIVIKMDILLQVDYYFTFYIVKNIQDNVRNPKKSTVRFTLIYKGYQNGISSQQITFKKIRTPVINDGSIKGFYLLNPATGLCIDLEKSDFVYGFHCSKFQVYHSMLYHEFGGCVYTKENTYSYKVGACDKDISNDEKAVKTWFGYPNLNLYRFWNGINATIDRKIFRISSTKPFSTDFQPIYTNFGWSLDKKQDMDEHSNNNAVVGRTASYVDENKNTYFSMRYKKNNEEKDFYIANGLIKPTATSIILKKFDKRFHRWGIVDGGLTKVFDLFRNWGSCNESLCTIKSVKWTSATNFIERLRDYNTFVERHNQKINYIGIWNVAVNNTVIMPRFIDCQYQVGQSKLTAMSSCKKIKEYCKAAKSGYYWIGGESMEIFHKVYCEMDTDGGGWLRILHAFVPEITDKQWNVIDAVDVVDNITQWFESNTTKYLSSPVGLGMLSSYMNYDEIRFYCRTDKPGYVNHFKTLKNERGFAVVDYFRNSSITLLPHMCKSFHAFEDDTTSNGVNCATIGPQATDEVNGHWSIGSSVYTNIRIYKNTYVIKSFASFGLNEIRCHTHSALGNARIENGTFEISLR